MTDPHRPHAAPDPDDTVEVNFEELLEKLSDRAADKAAEKAAVAAAAAATAAQRQMLEAAGWRFKDDGTPIPPKSAPVRGSAEWDAEIQRHRRQFEDFVAAMLQQGFDTPSKAKELTAGLNQLRKQHGISRKPKETDEPGKKPPVAKTPAKTAAPTTAPAKDEDKAKAKSKGRAFLDRVLKVTILSDEDDQEDKGKKSH